MKRTFRILAAASAIILVTAIAPQHILADENASAGVVTGSVVSITATEIYIDIGLKQGVRVDDLVQISTKTGNPISVELNDVWAEGARAHLAANQIYPIIGARVTVTIPGGRAPKPDATPRPLPLPLSAQTMAPRWDGVDLHRHQRVSFRPATTHEVIPTDPEELRVHGTVGIESVALWNPLSKLALYNQFSLRSDLDIGGIGGPWGSQIDYSHRLRLRYDLATDISSRRFTRSRHLARIRRLRVGFTRGGLHADIGRSGTVPVPDVGIIDGVAIRHRLRESDSGFLDVGAWAGARPRIDDLYPTVSALGFGVFSAFRKNLDQAKQRDLAIDVGLIGSTYDGQLDRRALAVAGSLTEPKRWVHTQVVLDLNRPQSDPSRPSVEPTSFFVDIGSRLTRNIRASARIDHVRSLRTAEALAQLPIGYLSTAAFSSVRGTVSWQLRRGLSVDSRAGWRLAAEGSSSLWSSASVRASGIFFGDDHASISIDGSLGHYIDGASVRTRYSLPLFDNFDVTAGYRFHGYRYGGENARLWMHQPSLSLESSLPASLYGSLDVDGYLGSEELGIGVLATLTRRF